MCRAVIPLCAYLLVFQWLVLQQAIQGFEGPLLPLTLPPSPSPSLSSIMLFAPFVVIIGGIIAVVFGLWLFIIGLEYGLMPIGEGPLSTFLSLLWYNQVCFITNYELDIGVSISAKLPRWIVLILACVLGDPPSASPLRPLLHPPLPHLGIGCTLAEPAIGALQTIGQIVKLDTAPYSLPLLLLLIQRHFVEQAKGQGASIEHAEFISQYTRPT